MGADDTLHYMQAYWKDYQGHDESFWEHEWGKHGTCITTLDPGCYDDYVPTEEAAAFFSKTVSLFKTLPSGWLTLASPLTIPNLMLWTIYSQHSPSSTAPG